MTSGCLMLAMILNLPRRYTAQCRSGTLISVAAPSSWLGVFLQGLSLEYASIPLRLHHLAPNLAVRRKDAHLTSLQSHDERQSSWIKSHGTGAPPLIKCRHGRCFS